MGENNPELVASKELVNTIVEGIQEKKGANITILDLRKIENMIAEYFVICDGDSNVHVDALSDSVEEVVRRDAGEKPFHVEGKQNAEWILLDYMNVVVHVFQKQVRNYYNLEELWADAGRTDIENLF
ncbi:ribosome silencing factor [Marinilabilia rubra]|uniref:Ribosomal silencing factor RsfS n=1 Tax=Marinilabilia rubra TaxID=2162893 RepID=A0A2U2BDL5_9BACT|nr:ribosome silencing factor [Marinilabilia rubra]PWE01164.1 ribosome silencing factor [Marinilabilia rubra]